MATDQAGNADPTPASYPWTINTTNKEATAPDITVNPATLPFGNVNIDSSSERTVSVRNDGNGDLAIGAIRDLSLPFSKLSDNCSGKTLAPSTGCTITVRFAPASTGTFNSTFDIPSNDPDENPVTVSLTGTGANAGSPDITVLPSLDLSFPNISVGVTADQTVNIKNDGTADLTISIITSPSTPFSIVTGEDNCSNHTLAPNQSCTMKVRFTPAASGTFKSSFNIPSNDPDENLVTINLSGSVTPGSNNPPDRPNLSELANGAAGMPTTLTLKWDKSTDPEGDPITYKLYMGTDPSFANVNPMIVASISNKNNSAMAFRYSMGIFGLFGIIAIGGLSKNRRRIGFLIVTVIFVGGVLLTSYGSGGSTSDNSDNSDKKDYVSYTVNLQPITTYYWKVVADDGKGGTTESDTYSFTTGR